MTSTDDHRGNIYWALTVIGRIPSEGGARGALQRAAFSQLQQTTEALMRRVDELEAAASDAYARGETQARQTA